MAVWKAQRTLLIVGEGRDEVAFLSYLKSQYVPRGCGLSVTIKDAHGKGALHVIDRAAAHRANADFDQVAALLDMDTWDAKAEKLAKRKKILVLGSDPCFEAMMLRLVGEKAAGNSHALKKQFLPFIKNDPSCSDNYSEYFGSELLQSVRSREPTINSLLALFVGEST